LAWLVIWLAVSTSHKIESIEGFTKKYKVHRLVYYETYDHVITAINREKQLKGWRRKKRKLWSKPRTRGGRIWRNNGDEKCGYKDNLWGERPEFAFFGIGILGMFRLRRRIRSDCAQHDRG